MTRAATDNGGKTMTDYICAFDIGTTGVKAGILTPDGKVVGTAYREYGIQISGPQWVEQSVDEMWQAQGEACKQLLKDTAIDPKQIVAIGISCQRATFVPVDKDQKPLMNFIGWQDQRSIEQCDRMKKQIGLERYYKIAGLPLDPIAAISKIVWLKDNRPDIFEKAHLFASTQNVHLTQLGVENAPCDLPDAAYLGLLDVDNLAWSVELLDTLGIPAEKMPRLVPSGTQVGTVSKAAAEATGLAEGTPIVTAGGDLQNAGLGMGVAEPGYVSVGIGTGGGVLICTDRPLRHPDIALNCLPHAVAGTWEMEGIALASGGAYKWVRDTLGESECLRAAEEGVDPYELLNAQAGEAPAGSNGLLMMPMLLGAGSPNWDPQARGVILGLKASTSKCDIVRAVMEGICLELRWIIESAERLGTAIEEVRIWGGAAKSPLWNQIAANVYGVPAARTEVPDAGLIGASICAGVGVGMFADARDGARRMVRIAERYEPDPAASAKYTEMFGIYKDAYKALRDADVFERIAAV
jgi:xylulokinase